MSHSLADRRPVVRWRSTTGRICLLTIAADGTPESYYEPRNDNEVPAGCETHALEQGFNLLRLQVVVARLAIEAMKREREALSRTLGGRTIDDAALNEASHRAADALSKFERAYGSGRPWCENLVGAPAPAFRRD